jgi:hypothetical protein
MLDIVHQITPYPHLMVRKSNLRCFDHFIEALFGEMCQDKSADQLYESPNEQASGTKCSFEVCQKIQITSMNSRA